MLIPLLTIIFVGIRCQPSQLSVTVTTPRGTLIGFHVRSFTFLSLIFDLFRHHSLPIFSQITHLVEKCFKEFHSHFHQSIRGDSRYKLYNLFQRFIPFFQRPQPLFTYGIRPLETKNLRQVKYISHNTVTFPSPACSQFSATNLEMSEDCLYLNVITPSVSLDVSFHQFNI